jgi:outer membrane protein TolC
MLRLIHRLQSPIASLSVVCQLALAVSGASVVVAQTPGTTSSKDSIPLSLDGAVRRAMQKNEDIVIARSQVRGAMAQRASARSAFMPQITSQTSYTRTLRGPFDDIGSVGEAGGDVGPLLDDLLNRKNNYGNTIGASQLLFDRRALSNLRAAHEAEQVQELQLTERELDVTLQIVQAYYGAVLADRVVEISEAALEEATKQLDHVQKTHQAGNASEMDVLNVEVQRDNLEPGRVDALNDRDQALRNLRRLIDLRDDQALQLTDTLEPETFQALSAPVLDSLARMYTRRGSIAAADRNIRIQKLRESGARGSRLPSIALGASFAKSGTWANGTPDSEDLRDSWTLSIALQAPIFDGGMRKADVASAHELAVQSQLQLDQMKKAIALDVAQQRGELDRAAASVEARSHTAALAERNYTLMTLAYDKGVVNTLQLSDARLQLRQARVNEVQALHDYYVALARLRRAAGHSPYSIN